MLYIIIVIYIVYNNISSNSSDICERVQTQTHTLLRDGNIFNAKMYMANYMYYNDSVFD